MKYDNALRKYVLDLLPVRAELIDVEVTWDDGYSYDPTYGSSSSAPTFDIVVYYRLPGDDFRMEQRLNTSLTFTAMLRALLEISEERP